MRKASLYLAAASAAAFVVSGCSSPSESESISSERLAERLCELAPGLDGDAYRFMLTTDRVARFAGIEDRMGFIYKVLSMCGAELDVDPAILSEASPVPRGAECTTAITEQEDHSQSTDGPDHD